MTLIEEIEHLKKEKNAVILAHYYVCDEVQEIADYVGDSYYLAKVAVELKEKVIVFAGVKFMGESAKILNPDKKVLMPDAYADCPMAHMAEVERIEEVRSQYEDVAVVCYINSTTELKMHSDVCVTSANAMKIVNELPNKNIFFIPDKNLGNYIATKLPDKNFIINPGFCHVHNELTKEMIEKAKEAHPDALVLMHPECTLEALTLADYIGSTSGIIQFAGKSDAKEFIVATEMGVLYKLTTDNPTKRFYSAGNVQICPNMKKISLEKVRDCLRDESNEISVPSDVSSKALIPLNRMLELAGR